MSIQKIILLSLMWICVSITIVGWTTLKPSGEPLFAFVIPAIITLFTLENDDWR